MVSVSARENRLQPCCANFVGHGRPLQCELPVERPASEFREPIPSSKVTISPSLAKLSSAQLHVHVSIATLLLYTRVVKVVGIPGFRHLIPFRQICVKKQHTKMKPGEFSF
jgi:hypothetical protein